MSVIKAEIQFKPNTTVAAIVRCGEHYLLVEEYDGTEKVINQPAGHLEAGESLEQAVIRELYEETGLTLAPKFLTGIYYMHSERNLRYYLRFCFYFETDKLLQCTPQDSDIINANWYSLAEIGQLEARLRSPLVMRCIRDQLAGEKIPLSTIKNLL